VTWSVASGPGTITAGGVFSSAADGTATVRAASVDNPAIFAEATVTVVRPAVPQNNDFGGRTLIGGLEGNITGSNLGATKETREPRHAGNVGGGSVWFEWTAPVSGTVQFDTAGSDFDTLLAVYTGETVDRLRRVAQNNNQARGVPTSLVRFRVRAGVKYQIAVDGFNAATGLFNLNWDYTAIPVTGVTLNLPSYNLVGIGSTVQLTATVLPEEAFNKNVTWRSSNRRVATVDQNGLVTAHRPGRTTITVRTVDGNRRAICRITVQ
jgi:hypothetical protein